MRQAKSVLTGIKQLSGLMHFFAGVDKERAQITNVSVWDSVENAKQLSTFQPMLDLGKEFSAKGATFLRPIPNFECLWEWPDISSI